MSDHDRLTAIARNLLSRAAELLDGLAQDAAARHVHRAVAVLGGGDDEVPHAARDDALPLMRAALATLDAAGEGGGRTACSLQAAINFAVGAAPMVPGEELPDGWTIVFAEPCEESRGSSPRGGALRPRFG